jgi:hypothetical protein
MEPLKRISTAEIENYIELSIYDEKVCTKAIAFTLTPSKVDTSVGLHGQEGSLFKTQWMDVTYYGDESSISNTSLSPLEFMYKEWNMNKDIDLGRDLGDERESNVHSYL